jgi:hypothetical protein
MAVSWKVGFVDAILAPISLQGDAGLLHQPGVALLLRLEEAGRKDAGGAFGTEN